MNREKTRKQLERHEGRRKFPYDDATGEEVSCTEGDVTIGVGWNLTVRGLPAWAINRLANEAISEAHTLLQKETYYLSLNNPRRAVCISMVINLGWGGYRSFRNMRSALREENYEAAAREMKDSKWASQVGRRSEELAEQMLTGVWHPTI